MNEFGYCRAGVDKVPPSIGPTMHPTFHIILVRGIACASLVASVISPSIDWITLQPGSVRAHQIIGRQSIRDISRQRTR